MIAGAAKETAGQLVSAAGTALEFIAQYGYHPAQIEAMNFNPSMDVPERDISLVKEYVTDPTQEFGDELSKNGRTQIEDQKEGLGSFGRFAVDLGSAATQLVLDLGLGVITGGGMAVPAAIRAFGGAATEARADGATLEEQMLYATTSAVISYGVESACNLAFKGLKAVSPGISDEFLTRGIEKIATKLASTPEGAELLMKFGSIAVSGASEGGEEFVEAMLQPFLKKLIVDPDTKTILDDLELFWDYAYEGLIGGILGVVSSNVNVNTNTDTDADVRADANPSVQTNMDPGVESAVQQYVEAVEMFSGETAQNGKSSYAPLETMDPAELDFDELFYASEDDAASDTDTAADSLMPSDEFGNTEEFEQSFLSGLQADEESGIIQKGNSAETTNTAKTAQTKQTAAEASTDPGVESAVQQYIKAVEMFGGKTDRKIQSPALHSTNGNLAVHREVEAMIDRTAPKVKGAQQTDAAHILEGADVHILNNLDGAHHSAYFGMVDADIAIPKSSISNPDFPRYYANTHHNTLTSIQKSRLNTLENTINDHLTEKDFSGALRDLLANPVPNGNGGYFDHVHEIRDSYRSLQKIKKALEGSLKNPTLSNEDRTLLQDGFDMAAFYIRKIEELFGPYGGIR